MVKRYSRVSNDAMEIGPTCNLYTGQCELKIPEGHERCFQCKGVGCFLDVIHYKEKKIGISLCPQCHGKGYIDWIQNIRKTKKHILLHSRWMNYLNFNCKTSKSCKVIKRWIKNKKRGLIDE
jgi:hypothetical protein